MGILPGNSGSIIFPGISALLHLDFWLFIDYDNEHAVCKCMQLLLNLNLSFDVMIFGELCPFIKLFCALPCHYV